MDTILKLKTNVMSLKLEHFYFIFIIIKKIVKVDNKK